MKDFGGKVGGEGSAVSVSLKCEPTQAESTIPIPVILEGGESENNNKRMNTMTIDLTQVSESEDEVVAIPGLSQQGEEMHCKIVNAFTKAFAKQNVHFEKGISIYLFYL
jgi:hypothetical protein